MSKKVLAVENANGLDDDAYKTRLVPALDLGDQAELKIEFISAAALSKRNEDSGETASELESCFQLLRSTSIEDYKNSSTGWSESDKRQEMCLPDMRYLLVRKAKDDSIQGFSSFMITYEDGYEVIYVYEIHLTEGMRGTGMGATLMGIVEEVGRRARMSKVMLTVFTRNKGAARFYHRLGYALDEYSPQPRKLRRGVVKEPDYQILSKALGKAEGPQRCYS